MAKNDAWKPGRGILARWYADPLASSEAENLLQAMEAGRGRFAQHRRRFTMQLMRLALIFWSEPRSRKHLNHCHDYYEHLKATGSTAVHARALLELLWGQLLISSQLSGAWQHLENSVQLAGHLYAPEDYFVIMERHRLLQAVPLQQENPSAAMSLQELLRLGSVISQLQQTQTHHTTGKNHDDTTG